MALVLKRQEAEGDTHFKGTLESVYNTTAVENSKRKFQVGIPMGPGETQDRMNQICN